MPTYDYRCPKCKSEVVHVVPIAERGEQKCAACGVPLERLLSAPYGRVMFEGRVLKGGGPDRFTADVMGISDLRDLPSGLRTNTSRPD